MLKKPSVAVLLTNYNHAEYIEECVNSLINQTYENIAYYFFDDASTDGSYEYLVSMAKLDRRIKVIRNKKNQGFIKTLNIAKKYVEKFDYCYRVDSDDIFEHSSVERLVLEAEDKALDVVSSYSKTFGDVSVLYTPPSEHIEIIKVMMFTSCISHSGVLINNKFYKKVQYDEKFKYCEDYKLWTDLAIEGAKFGNVREVLMHYRKHSTGATVMSASKDVVYAIYKIRKAFNDRMSYYPKMNAHLGLQPSNVDMQSIVELNRLFTDSTKEMKEFMLEVFSGYMTNISNASAREKFIIFHFVVSSFGNNMKFTVLTLFSVLHLDRNSTVFRVVKRLKAKLAN